MIWQLIDSSSVGGAERHIATLSRSLVARGHAVKVMLYERHGANPWLSQLGASGLPYAHLDGSFSGLRRALASERPALLHTHGYKAGILGRLAARLTGVPAVSTYHSGQRGSYPVGLYEWLDDWSGILAQRIAVSDAIAARLPFQSPVVPSYVAVPGQPSVAPLPPTVAFVGRLSHEKGPDLFCEFAAACAAPLSWHIYGDGPMRAELEQRFGNVVAFHGIQPDIEKVWPELGLVMMPSRFEGVPLTALEAGAHGIPVLASAVGGLPQVVEHGVNGWLFDASRLDGATAALACWMAARATNQNDLRYRCWARIRDRYSEERWLPEIEEVYLRAGLVPDTKI